jgi:predicted amidohydrolase
LGTSAGSRVETTMVGDVRVGVATCFDFYFPEYFAALSKLSPDLILGPSYQRSESPERLMCMSQTRAIDSGAWFVRSSYAIAGGRTGGCSLIAAPDGQVVVNAGGEPRMIEAEIDPKAKFVKPRSHGMPDIDHRALIASRRRPDVY